jgi:hypothetical protein
MTSPYKPRAAHGWQKPRASYTLKEATSDLIELTEGQVQPNDFFQLSQSEEPQSSEAA